MELETVLFRVGEFGIILSVLASLAALIARAFRRGKAPAEWANAAETASRWISAAAFLAVTVLIAARIVRTGHGPFTNIYEFSVVFVWGILLIGGLVRWKYGSGVLQLLGNGLAAMLLFYAATLSAEAKPLVPALQNSLLLSAHVFSAVIAYGAFTIGFLASVLLLAQRGDRIRALPAAETLETIGYRCVIVGFPFMTLVIVLGAIWADVAWGSFWSWDPKETASLVTWLIYAGYLHTRILSKWQGRKSAIFLIAGFAAVVFTFFGNYVFSGLHAYL